MKKSLLLALFLTVLICVPAWAAEQVIAGAGPSTKIVQLFAEEFASNPAAKGITFKVPPKSAKHAGGIENSDTYVFGRTGRPLNEKEKKLGKDEIFLARIPIAFATGSDVGVKSITLKQLEGIITGKINNWSQVGGSNGQITLIGREATEAMFSVIKKKHPFFKNAAFNKILEKDHHVVAYLRKPGSDFAFGFGAKPNFEGMHIIDIEGLEIGASVGLVYDLKNKDHALVNAAREYAKSNEWAKKVIALDVFPPEQ